MARPVRRIRFVPDLGCPGCGTRTFEVSTDRDITFFRCVACGCRCHVELGFVIAASGPFEAAENRYA